MTAGETSLGGLQRAASPTAPPAGARLYVQVTDMAATLERAAQLGGTVERWNGGTAERARITLGGDDRWFAIAQDTAGVSFGLWTVHISFAMVTVRAPCAAWGGPRSSRPGPPAPLRIAAGHFFDSG